MVGYHASHEQHRPRGPAGPRRAAEAAGFDAVSSSDHFTPWSEPAGRVRLRVVVARRGDARDHACRSAWSTRRGSATTRRSSPRRSPRSCELFPGRLWVALGIGRGLQRAHHGRPLAVEAGPQRATARVRRGHPSAAAGRGGVGRRPRAGRPSPAVDAAGRACRRSTARRCREATARWCGSWADGLLTVHRSAGASCVRSSTRSARVAARASRSPCRRRSRIGAHRRRGRSPRALRAVADQRLRLDADGRSRDRRAVRDRGARTCRPRRSPSAVLCSADLGPARRRSSTTLLDVRRRRPVRPSRAAGTGRVPRRLRRPRSCRSSDVRSMSIRATSDQWWKGAIVYCLDVETFLDWDGDGMGDLAGLTERIDYLAGLGVSVLWLMPFHPTPDRDDGYDITDFYGVDPRLGHPRPVRRGRPHRDRPRASRWSSTSSSTTPPTSTRGSRQRGRSPRLAATATGTCGSTSRPTDCELEEVFPGEQGGVWTFDEEAGQWYLHRFYEHQPDLNITNPEVREEIARIMGFWLAARRRRVPGRRRAVPARARRHPVGAAGGPDPHQYLQGAASVPPASPRRRHPPRRGEPPAEGAAARSSATRTATSCTSCSSSRSCSGSTWRWPAGRPTSRARPRRASRGAVRLAVGDVPAQPRRAHPRPADRATSAQEVFDAFGPDADMQLYGRGLRRRLPPMLGGDEARLRMAYSLLFSLPGTPVLFYGEEIGMGENLEVAGPLRRPHADAVVRRARRRVLDRAERRRSRVPLRPGRVRARSASTSPPNDQIPSSLLNWFERMIRRRRETHELALGQPEVVSDRSHPGVRPPLRLGRPDGRRRAQPG